MKELSIEEKAKAYDEAIERARVWKERSGMPADRQGILDDIFPELKESEDEKIRKGLIDYFNNFHLQTFAGIDPKKILSWLEEQGEQNLVNTDLDELVIQLEETIGTSPHSRKTIKDFFQKAVQKYMNCLKIANGEIGSLIEENYRLKEKQGEQKSDIGISSTTKQKLKDSLNNALAVETGESWNEFLGEQKSAWSAKDEIALNDALWCCRQAASIAKDENDMGNAWYAENWLNSLKERYTWKPSDEQMEALLYEVNAWDEDSVNGQNLKSLYQDLKKLREE